MGGRERRKAEDRHPIGQFEDLGEAVGLELLGPGRQELGIGGPTEVLLHGAPQRGLPELVALERGTHAVEVALVAPAPHHLRAVERVAVEQVGDRPGPHRVGGLAQLGAELLEDLVHRPRERAGGPTADARALPHRAGDDAGGKHELDVGDDPVPHRRTLAVAHHARLGGTPAGGPAAR